MNQQPYNWDSHWDWYEKTGRQQGLCYSCWSMSLMSGCVVKNCPSCRKVNANDQKKKGKGSDE